MTHKKYTELVFQAFEESDYSRIPSLRNLTMGDMYAVSRLMHDHNIDPTMENVLRAATHRHMFYMDESMLANVEFADYMDASDAMGFSSGFMEQIVMKTAGKAREKLTEHGFYLIELTQPSEHAGFYAFAKGAVDA